MLRHCPLFALLSLTACDGDGGIDPDDTGFDSLDDLIDLSVNDASAAVDADGLLRLRTEEGDNDAGGFNGTGTGNKAIAGLPGFDGLALLDLHSLAVESTAVSGGSSLYFNVIVDLSCGSGDLSLIVADATVGTITDLGGGLSRGEYSADEAQWKAVGGLDELLPEHLDSTGGRLSSVVASYPLACLRDADTGDAGMPKDTVTTAIMLILGDSLNHSAQEQRVSRVEVN